MSNDTNVWFVRHGESEYNQKGLFTGWHDPKLTEVGITQIKDLQHDFNEKFITFDKIFCSTLRRSIDSAVIMAREFDSPYEDMSLTLVEELKERNYGDWSGQVKEEILKNVGEEEFLNVRRGWETKPPNGESLRDVAIRVEPFIQKNFISNPGGNYLVVAHGNTIRAIAVIIDAHKPETIHMYEIEVGNHLKYRVINE